MVANFSASGVVHLLNELGILIHLASHNKEREAQFRDEIAKDPKYGPALSDAADSIEFILKATDNFTTLFPCSHITAASKRLDHWRKNDEKTFGDVFERSCRLRDAITTELRDYVFYAYPKDKGISVRSWKKDWAKALGAFPEIDQDVFGAVDCCALKHHTASVFHSMRIAEHGLRALARERKIRLPKNKPVEWGTWQEIIGALDGQIKLLGHTKAGPKKDATLSFYSGARADLNGFKDEYRNAVMHVRASYDEFQALRALANVHAFMDRIAERLAPKGANATAPASAGQSS